MHVGRDHRAQAMHVGNVACVLSLMYLVCFVGRRSGLMPLTLLLLIALVLVVPAAATPTTGAGKDD